MNEDEEFKDHISINDSIEMLENNYDEMVNIDSANSNSKYTIEESGIKVYIIIINFTNIIFRLTINLL